MPPFTFYVKFPEMSNGESRIPAVGRPFHTRQSCVCFTTLHHEMENDSPRPTPLWERFVKAAISTASA